MNRKMIRALCAWTLACLMLLSGLTAWADPNVANSATDTGLDVVIVIDCSGTMLRTDPNGIALMATQQFSDRCSSNDNLAYVSYGYDVRTSGKFYNMGTEQDTFVADVTRDNAIVKNDDTNTGLALDTARQMIERQRAQYPDHEFAILLLSDGRIDFGDSDGFKQAYQPEDAPALEASSRQMAEDCARNSGVPIYGLRIFSANQDMNDKDMEDWARLSGGSYRATSSVDEVVSIMRDFYEDLKDQKKISVMDGRFQIQTNVLEANIEIMPTVNVGAVELTGPNGAVDLYGADVTVRQHSAYTIIKLSKPASGDWEIRFTDGDVHTFDVQVTTNPDLNMTLSAPSEGKTRQKLQLVLEAQKQGLPYYDPAQPATLIVRDASGYESAFQMTWDSVSQRYIAEYEPQDVGDYTFTAQLITTTLVNNSNAVTVSVTSGGLAIAPTAQGSLDYTFDGHILGMYTSYTLPVDLSGCFLDPDHIGVNGYEVRAIGDANGYVDVLVDQINGRLTYTPRAATANGAAVFEVRALSGNGEKSAPVTATIVVNDAQQPIMTVSEKIAQIAPIEIRALLPEKQGKVVLSGLSSYFVEPNAVDGETVTVTSVMEELAAGAEPLLDVVMENDALVATGLKEGVATVTISAISSDGSSDSFQVSIKVVSLLGVILMIAAGVLAAIILLVIILIIARNAAKPAFRNEASLSVSIIDMDRDSEGSDMLRKYRKSAVKLSEICHKAGVSTAGCSAYLEKIYVLPRKGGVRILDKNKGAHQKEINLRPFDVKTIDLDAANEITLKIEYFEGERY